MIEVGNTIVYRDENGILNFYWLCSVLPDGYLFFSWFANPRRAAASDYWLMTRDWFSDKVKKGVIEVYPSLPLDKYGDVFEVLAAEKNHR